MDSHVLYLFYLEIAYKYHVGLTSVLKLVGMDSHTHPIRSDTMALINIQVLFNLKIALPETYNILCIVYNALNNL